MLCWHSEAALFKVSFISPPHPHYLPDPVSGLSWEGVREHQSKHLGQVKTAECPLPESQAATGAPSSPLPQVCFGKVF